ncbi:MAG TPA: hypothetical protein PKL88_02045 [bacterium]|nr:hypothetical protein [bacterium]
MQEDFSEDYVPQSNWMKFEKVGDYIKGTFVSKRNKPAEGKFPAQIVYELVNCEGVSNGVKMELDADETVLVGISKDFINSRFKKVEEGRRMGVKFIKEIPSTTKGFDPAKSLMPYVWGIDEKYNFNKLKEDMGGEEINVNEAIS